MADHFHISQDDIEFFKPENEQVLLRNAVVPAAELRDQYFHPFANELLTDLLCSLNIPKPINAPQRIFASHATHQNPAAPKRICINEKALVDIAAARGFVSVRPETMTWPEQISLFRDAEIVVGQADSGLHNALFCTPGRRLASIGL